MKRVAGLKRLENFNLDENSKDYIVMHHLISDLKYFIPKLAKGDLLDIGCGNKPYESLFNNIATYTGCDVVQSSLNKVDIICEAKSLRFESDKFDTIFSTQVLEHVDDPFKMIHEAFRVLRPKGNIILTAPFIWELHEEPYDYFRFTKYGLKVIFEKAGFKNIVIKSNGGKWAAISQIKLNVIYSNFHKKTFIIKMLKLFFIHFKLTYLINRIVCWFDKKYYDDILTLNYIITAQKTND